MVDAASDLQEAASKVPRDERTCFSRESIKCTYIVWTTKEKCWGVYSYPGHYTANGRIIEPFANLLKLLLFQAS